MMRKPFHLADSLHLQLYCGEFGVIEKAPVGPKLDWDREMVSIVEKQGVAYANWNLKAGSFGITDENLTPDRAMVNILTGKETH